MSSVTGSGALGFFVVASLVAACGGSGGNDLFGAGAGSSSTSCGLACGATDAGSKDERGSSSGDTTGTTSSSTSTTGSSSATTGAGTAAGGAGGAATSSTSAATGAGGGAGGTTTGGAGGGGGTAGGQAGSGGAAGSGGSPVIDAGGGRDATLFDAPVMLDAPSATPPDAHAVVDACKPMGMEICDGLDNNCNGDVDEHAACPPGCIGASFRGVGYMFCSGGQQKAWQDAQKDCMSNGGMHLARVDDAEVDKFARTLALTVGYKGILWLGGSDITDRQTWAWTDGTPFWNGLVRGNPINGRYSAWDMGQPNNATGNEHCVAKYENDTWHDDTCSTRYAFLCQQ